MKFAKEAWRDMRALGSLPFYLIVAIRAVIGQFYLFFWQLAIGAACLLIVDGLTNKKKDRVDMRVAAAFVLAVFTSYFYKQLYFTIFAFVLLGLVIASSKYQKVKNNTVFSGIVLGALSSVAAFYIAPFIAGL